MKFVIVRCTIIFFILVAGNPIHSFFDCWSKSRRYTRDYTKQLTGDTHQTDLVTGLERPEIPYTIMVRLSEDGGRRLFIPVTVAPEAEPCFRRHCGFKVGCITGGCVVLGITSGYFILAKSLNL